MANDQAKGTHNQPSHEAQVKGGQHSHQGGQQGSSESSIGQPEQGRGGQQSKEQDGRSHNQPGHEAQVKGGQHSHSDSTKK